MLSQGYKCTYITSDFNHYTKEFYKVDKPDTIQIPTKPYKKNLSFSRLYSHIKFAKDAIKKVEELNPDILYVEIPPNSLSRQAAKYKRKNKKVNLVFDIFDMWPETFPNNKMKKLLKIPFGIWAGFRDKNLSVADFVITECNMFREMLGLSDKNSKTIYLCADNADETSIQLREDLIELCYLGSINNIIDIPAISNLIKEISLVKPVKLHIIGKGEKEEEFINQATLAGAQIERYGPIYDTEKKAEIIKKCRFGINIMKSDVCIGLTMKSVDYFRFGLPIINNIPSDTQKLVNNEGIGIQLDENTASAIVEMSLKDCIKMRENVTKTFNEKFERSVIMEEYKNVFTQVL